MKQEKQTLRKTIIFIDYSESIQEDDYKPSRQIVVLEALSKLLDKFEQNNPLSQLGVYLLRNLKCDNFIGLNSTTIERTKIMDSFVSAAQNNRSLNIHSSLQIKAVNEHEPSGQISLYNAFKVAQKVFSEHGDYAFREIYFILSSIGTNDANDIYEAIKLLGNRKVKINIISLNCENFLYREIVKRTGGQLFVPNSKHDFEEVVYNIADPIFILENDSYLFCVAFISLVHTTYPFYCSIHNDWVYKGYRCSKCGNIHCSSISTCSVCAVRLISPVDIVRRSINEGLREKFEEEKESFCDFCFDASYKKCIECKMKVCGECFEFIFENIRFCLGCFSI